MAGPSLYGSFRTGLTFGSGDATLGDFTSRWGFQGSYEIAEGLTASYKYESKFNSTNAESSGGEGHGHDAVAGTPAGADTPAMERVEAGEAIAALRREIFAHDFALERGDYTPVDADDMPHPR